MRWRLILVGESLCDMTIRSKGNLFCFWNLCVWLYLTCQDGSEREGINYLKTTSRGNLNHDEGDSQP